MLAETQKQLIYLENQQKIWQRKILRAKELIIEVTGFSDISPSLTDTPLKEISKDYTLLWEVLSDFSYDISTLIDYYQILSHLHWRFSSFLSLDYVQLTLKEGSEKDSTWDVYFLKSTEEKGFAVSQKQYPFNKIEPCTKLTFHQDKTQKIQSFVAIPLSFLGERLGALGFASRNYFAWEEFSESFYTQLSKIFSRRAYSICLKVSKQTLLLKFVDFASGLLEPFKKKAEQIGIDFDYSFSGSLLKETRPYVVGELEQWLNLIAKDTLERTGEPTVHINFYEKNGKPLAQILSIGSPRLLGNELANYLKERENFPTIQRKRDTYSVEIAFE